MVENIFVGKAKESNGLTLICRLKYISYSQKENMMILVLIGTE